MRLIPACHVRTMTTLRPVFRCLPLVMAGDLTGAARLAAAEDTSPVEVTLNVHVNVTLS